MADIAALLKESMALHDLSKSLRRQRRTVSAQVSLAEAARLRREAHSADPGHTDPAWADEQGKTAVGRDTHTDLMAFYIEQGV